MSIRRAETGLRGQIQGSGDGGISPRARALRGLRDGGSEEKSGRTIGCYSGEGTEARLRMQIWTGGWVR
jgi:hypothetical protein